MPAWPAAKPMDPVVGIDVHSISHALRRTGLTAPGVRQVLQGMPVTSMADRQVVAQIVARASARAPLSSERRAGSHSEQPSPTTTSHVSLFLARQQLAQQGISALGVHQLLSQQPVADPSDRKTLTAVVVHAASGLGMHFWPRVGGEVVVT